MIETRALTKRYGDSIVAVDDLDLGVRRDEVYGFLGPNGAGKTTRRLAPAVDGAPRQARAARLQRSSQLKGARMTSAIDHIRARTTAPPLPDGVWSVDPQHSEIGFAVKEMWGLRAVRGVFGAYDGSLKVRGGGAAGELTIEAGSLDTGNNKRDQHLRSPAFFDVERQPRIVFAAMAVTARDDGLTVTGELAVGSSRVRLEIPVNVEQMVDGALRLEGKTTVSRKATGVAWNKLGMIRGDAMLHAQLTLKRATS